MCHAPDDLPHESPVTAGCLEAFRRPSDTVRSSALVQASAGGARRIVQLAGSGTTGAAFLTAAMDIGRTDNCDLILLCSEVPSTARFHEVRAAQALIEDAFAEVLVGHDLFALKEVPQVSPAALKFLRTGALRKLFGDPAWLAVSTAVGAGRVTAAAPSTSAAPPAPTRSRPCSIPCSTRYTASHCAATCLTPWGPWLRLASPPP